MTNLFKKKYLQVPHISIANAIREIGRNSFVDWILILIISLILIIIFITNSFYLYRAVTSGKIKSTDIINPSSEKVFDPKDLSSIINHFNTKEEVSIQAKKGYIGPGDPSI